MRCKKNKVICSSEHQSTLAHINKTTQHTVCFFFFHLRIEESCYRHTYNLSLCLSVCFCLRTYEWRFESSCAHLSVPSCVCECLSDLKTEYWIFSCLLSVLHIAVFSWIRTNAHAHTYALNCFAKHKAKIQYWQRCWTVMCSFTFVFLCVRALCYCWMYIYFIGYNCADAVCTEHTRAVNPTATTTIWNALRESKCTHRHREAHTHTHIQRRIPLWATWYLLRNANIRCRMR